MVEWLSDQYGVRINVVILKYIRSSSGAELLARTALSEEIEEERARKKTFSIPTSDEPGYYEHDELESRLRTYLKNSTVTVRRIETCCFQLAWPGPL